MVSIEESLRTPLLGVGGPGKIMEGKWRELHLNNNKKKSKEKKKNSTFSSLLIISLIIHYFVQGLCNFSHAVCPFYSLHIFFLVII